RRFEDRAWRRHEDRVHAAAADLPEHEERRDREHADRVRAHDEVTQALRCGEARGRNGRARGHDTGPFASSALSSERSSARHAANSEWARRSPPSRCAATGESTMVRMRPGAVANTKMRSDSTNASSIEWVTKITVAPVC